MSRGSQSDFRQLRSLNAVNPCLPSNEKPWRRIWADKCVDSTSAAINPPSQNSASSSHLFSVSSLPERCVSVVLVDSPHAVTQFHLKGAGVGNRADLTENGDDGENSTIRKGDKTHGTPRTCIVSLFQSVTYNLCLNNHRSPASCSNWIQSRLGTDETVTHITSHRFNRAFWLFFF